MFDYVEDSVILNIINSMWNYVFMLRILYFVDRAS
jgi:hypothetical protein